MQLGWADESFRAIADEGKGCGDDAHSWGYDGMRRLKWHNNIKEQYGRRWKAGDVISLAVNLEDKEVSFGLNGDWEGEMGCAFSGVTFEGAVYPRMSLMRGERVQINLGTQTNPFVYPPPEGFLPLTVTHPVVNLENEYNRFSSFAPVVQMGLAESSFTVSFPGEIMVTMMRRGLEYEGKKNALIQAGYQETLKKMVWSERDNRSQFRPRWLVQRRDFRRYLLHAGKTTGLSPFQRRHKKRIYRRWHGFSNFIIPAARGVQKNPGSHAQRKSDKNCLQKCHYQICR